jgi:hypothetical protein
MDDHFLKSFENKPTVQISTSHHSFKYIPDGLKSSISKANYSQAQWLTPAILATWEAEIERTMVRGQSRKTVHKTLSPK